MDESAGAAAGPFYGSIVAAVRSTINREPAAQYSIFVEHLDLSRFRGAAYEIAVKAYLTTKYHDRPIGVIVAVGIGALQYLMQYRNELWPQTPVVFAFVDRASLSSLELPPGVTGTTFRLKFSDMIAAARVVIPDLAGVAIVGDAVHTLVPYQHFAEEIPAAAAAGLQIIDMMGLPLREVRERVANLPQRTAIIYTVMYSDGEGRYLAPVEALMRFVDVANRPVVVTTDTQVGRGAVGGNIVVPALIGQAAGAQAALLLKGESPDAIPINDANAVRPIFDWRQLQRWQVSEAQLPAGSEVRFRRAGPWEQYRWEITAIALAVIAQAALINWLLRERRQRHRSEVVARNTLAELAHVNRLATGNELSASIAHEVMQPLTGIVSSANAGLRWLSGATPDIEKARALLNQIVVAGHRTADVVRAVRAVFKKESEVDQPVGMNELIEKSLALVAGNLRSHGIAVETRLDASLPIVPGDPVQLQQVLLNLIGNAVDAMLTIQRAERAIRVRSEISEGGICVSVEDTGTGVDEDKLDQIFKPMFTTKDNGMGLGLSICRSILEAHSGRIWASSRKPGGLAVHFYLPAGRP